MSDFALRKWVHRPCWPLEDLNTSPEAKLTTTLAATRNFPRPAPSSLAERQRRFGGEQDPVHSRDAAGSLQGSEMRSHRHCACPVSSPSVKEAKLTPSPGRGKFDDSWPMSQNLSAQQHQNPYAHRSLKLSLSRATSQFDSLEFLQGSSFQLLDLPPKAHLPFDAPHSKSTWTFLAWTRLCPKMGDTPLYGHIIPYQYHNHINTISDIAKNDGYSRLFHGFSPSPSPPSPPSPPAWQMKNICHSSSVDFRTARSATCWTSSWCCSRSRPGRPDAKSWKIRRRVESSTL